MDMFDLIPQARKLSPFHFQFIKNHVQRKKITSNYSRNNYSRALDSKSAKYQLNYQMISPELQQSSQRQFDGFPSGLNRSDSILGHCEETTPKKRSSTGARQVQGYIPAALCSERQISSTQRR
ncbi:hypothetical protein SAY87_015009 [Trapa incisa]|uniref:Uncharacterized protein n=1 Tax=Trapa incisa TaxID=236973 RepID=A0AAN7GPE9_9MYRT|nr:hypothetical protein SAY87_015009 [Trapa incisa]